MFDIKYVIRYTTIKKDLEVKTIQLQIDDNNYDSFLTIIKNLKVGFIKNFTVNSDNHMVEIVSDSEQKYYEDLLNSMSDDDRIVTSTKTLKI